MKSNESPSDCITGPLLQDLVERVKAVQQQLNPVPSVGSEPLAPSVGSKPLDPPALYEDAGGAYNQDFTFPQE